jgi:cytochrome c-type biogenesis protein CcsB
VLNVSALKIFPIESDVDNRWATPNEYHDLKGHGTVEGDLFEGYRKKLAEARNSNNFQEADAVIAQISNLQKQISGAILPSSTKLNLEIFYNKINIFKSLFPIYLVLGILLSAIFFIQIFKPTMEFKLLGKILLGILLISFTAQTFGLALRWYISGHAPWSNGYESMIYISWATLLAGFVFMKRSDVTLGVASLIAGVTLLTAHMSWLNPELTNLVPVLKSYWLTLHVATITASYGFLGLGCLVGFLNMCIMIFKNKENQFRVNLTLKELSLIIEMALSVGLILLVIGNFLGGIWANESWGRYWGWDPKETWTLVTIIVYSFTLHLTLIPALRSTFTFSFMSFISFGAILMTYFGVNYYLSGLHSYADGDPVQIPVFVYYTLIVAGIVSVLAAYNEYKFDKPREEVNPEKIAN